MAQLCGMPRYVESAAQRTIYPGGAVLLRGRFLTDGVARMGATQERACVGPFKVFRGASWSTGSAAATGDSLARKLRVPSLRHARLQLA